jgi:thioredoxin 1
MTTTTIRELNDATFDEEIMSSPLPTIVEFWADWCGPCKMLTPSLHSIADDRQGEWRVYTVNSDDNLRLGRRYDVLSVPTMLVFADGELQGRLVGARGKGRLLQDVTDLLSPAGVS